MIHVRPATPEDVPFILRSIRGLAEYERLVDQCCATEEALSRHLFGNPRYCEALIAEDEGEPIGYAIYFHNYSTFLTRPGLYLEDLFVLPERRGRGGGKALLKRVAEIAAERGCGRLEWTVLDWNESAIGFYQKLGAQLLEDWRICRVTGEALTTLTNTP